MPLIVELPAIANRAAFEIGYALELENETQLKDMSLNQRLRNFRANVVLEMSGIKLDLTLVSSDCDVLYRYSGLSEGKDLCILNSKNGASKKWIVRYNGRCEQLEYSKYEFVEQSEIDTIIKMTDHFDFLEIINASSAGISIGQVQSSDGVMVDRVSSAMANGTGILIDVDTDDFEPSKITLDLPAQEHNGITFVIHFLDYVRYDMELKAPSSIKSDMEIRINDAMDIFYSEWSDEAQMYIGDLFDDMDRDCDGFINEQDLIAKLTMLGKPVNSSKAIADHMIRVFTDPKNPSEEFDFAQFCGFWIIAFHDSNRSVHVFDQVAMVQEFQKFFYPSN